VKKEVLIIAMTNRIDMIDPAIQRRGRFDHVIKVDFASEIEVQSLLDKLLSSLPKESDVDPSRWRKNSRAGRCPMSRSSCEKGQGLLRALAGSGWTRRACWLPCARHPLGNVKVARNGVSDSSEEGTGGGGNERTKQRGTQGFRWHLFARVRCRHVATTSCPAGSCDL
jgi:hypothetical protein